MSLSLALNNALSGLRVNQQSINVLSQNIANVNTPGYSRQIVNQSALHAGGEGVGVQIDEITRKIDLYLQRSVQTQGSTNATAQTISDYYDRVQNLLGKPGGANSIDAYVTNFFNALQKVAETPETNSLKSNAIASGVTIARQLSDLAANIYDLRFEADNEINSAVTTINGSLERLRSLNVALAKAQSLDQSAAGLQDERDIELKKLSGFLNISVAYASSGAVSVVAGDGSTLLEEGVTHRLSYTKAQSTNALIANAPFSSLDVITIGEFGQEVGQRSVLIGAGKSADVKSKLVGGSLDGLQQLRDVKFPAILDQLDALASRLRDQTNAIHNSGSGYPPATVLTGDRAVGAKDQYNWSGSVRIAVLQADGKPVPSRYADETYTGIRPLTIDLSRLDSGQGNGKPTMQTIVDEINNHFGAPANRLKLGNLNNIQLAADTDKLPDGLSPLFTFDLDVENISDKTSHIFVTDLVSLYDDSNNDITAYAQGAPNVSILPTNSYSTTLGSADVKINLAAPLGVAVGDSIYLGAPSGPVNGIPVGSLSGFFKVTAVNGNQVTFTSGGIATATGSVNDPTNVPAYPPYDTIAAGQQERTRDRRKLAIDTSGNPASKYYDITLNVSVIGEDNVPYSEKITYRVNNNERDLFNKRYNATATAGGSGTLVAPGSSQESLRAILVDKDGLELPKINGKYIDGEAYLKVIGGNSGATYAVAIDDLDSKQLGKPDNSPAEIGANRGFSHYFGLNNFFDSNDAVATGDSLRNSALNLKVQDRLVNNANLISTGTLVKQPKNVASGNTELYTYARYSGDNSVAQKLAKLNTQLLSFDAAGGLPQTQLSLQSYSGEILGFVSQQSAEATSNAKNSKALYDGFVSKSDSISGVNLDEELANTVVFQNAYSATARVITTVNKMYEDLLQAF